MLVPIQLVHLVQQMTMGYRTLAASVEDTFIHPKPMMHDDEGRACISLIVLQPMVVILVERHKREF